MNEQFTNVPGSGRIPRAINEIQDALRSADTVGGVGSLTDSTTRGRFIKTTRNQQDAPDAQAATPSTFIPRWG